jgi:reactive chlorine resistance protein C
MEESVNALAMYYGERITETRGDRRPPTKIQTLPLADTASPSGKCAAGTHSPGNRSREATREEDMGTRRAPVGGLASVGLSVTRCGLATTLLWIGALKFKDYEVENAEVLVTASPLTSRLRTKLGARKLARLIGVTQITLGSLIAAKPLAPRASAVGSFGAAGMMLGTLSFLVTTPEAWQEGQGVPQLSMLGEALLKDTVLLGASLLTAADSLRAARAGNRS